jgi:hypothetical protein
VNERPSEGEGLEFASFAMLAGQVAGTSSCSYWVPVRTTAPWCGGPRACWTMTPLQGRRRTGLVRHQRLQGVAQLDANGTKEATAATIWLGDCTSKLGAGAEQRRENWKRRQALVHTRDSVIGMCGSNG